MFTRFKPLDNLIMLGVGIALVYAMVVSVVNGVTTTTLSNRLRPIADELEQLLYQECYQAEHADVITTHGNSVIWDVPENELRPAHLLLPPDVKATSNEEPLTFFMVYDVREDLVGHYTVTGKPAYRLFASICVIYWPDKVVLGTFGFHGNDPPTTRPATFSSERGELDTPLAAWIGNLPTSDDIIVKRIIPSATLITPSTKPTITPTDTPNGIISGVVIETLTPPATLSPPSVPLSATQTAAADLLAATQQSPNQKLLLVVEGSGSLLEQEVVQDALLMGVPWGEIDELLLFDFAVEFRWEVAGALADAHLEEFDLSKARVLLLDSDYFQTSGRDITLNFLFADKDQLLEDISYIIEESIYELGFDFISYACESQEICQQIYHDLSGEGQAALWVRRP